jgi:hypothetical protein
MLHDGPSTDDHPMPRKVRPPTEVDVIAKQGQRWIKTRKLVPHVAAHQHARGADGKHVALAIVLAVVEFVGLEPGLAATAAVESRADLEQHPRVVPPTQLGADHRDRRHLVGQLQHHLERRGRGRAVVVQQPHPIDHGTGIRPGRGQPRSVRKRRRGHHDGRAEPGIACRVKDARRSDRALEQLPSVVVAAGVDRHEPLHRTALGLHRVQGSRQPTSAVMGDEHRSDDVTGADQSVGSDGR